MKKIYAWLTPLILALAFTACESDTPTTPITPLPPIPPVVPELPEIIPPTIHAETVNGVIFNMVKIDGGTFEMGGTLDQTDDALILFRPVHSVTLSNFWMSEKEITQAQYQAIMGYNPSYSKSPNLPVDRVPWDSAQVFCAKLSSLTGKNYALPTEAQWEYAARGGQYNPHTPYAGSFVLDIVGWYEDNAWGSMHEVGTKRPNTLSLYDMSGNVAEWCADWQAKYTADAQTNPTGPAAGTQRIVRGGSWLSDDEFCLVSFRTALAPQQVRNGVGFRIVLLP